MGNRFDGLSLHFGYSVNRSTSFLFNYIPVVDKILQGSAGGGVMVKGFGDDTNDEAGSKHRKYPLSIILIPAAKMWDLIKCTVTVNCP